MKALASFIMKGRAQAVMVASVLLVLALIITPLAIGSAAVIALVTLRQGAREGALVALLGVVALAALGLLLFGQPLALASAGALLWLPMLGLAEGLRLTRSLRLMVEGAALLGLLMVLGQHLVMDDVTAFWQQMLADYLSQMVDPAALGEAERNAMVAEIAPWMAGGIAAAWFIELVLALFLGRAWQAALEHPGGFGEEFRALRLGYWLLILVPILLLGGALGERPGLLAQSALVGMAAFFIQGVALVHGLVARLNGGPGWLIGFYLLLVFGMPASFTLISAAGYADGLVNFRARVRPRGPKADGG